MENVLLVILLLLALGLIAVVLLQRSEGGGLGLGGGGGGGGVMSARGAATALSKLTWGLGIAFLATSLALTVISARNSASSSVVDGLASGTPAQETAPPSNLDISGMLPPAEEDLTPPPAE